MILNSKLHLYAEATSPYNDGWTQEFYRKEMDKLVTSTSNYYTVLDGDGNKYADCGWEKDAKRICELHEGEGFTYRHASELQQPEL